MMNKKKKKINKRNTHIGGEGKDKITNSPFERMNGQEEEEEHEHLGVVWLEKNDEHENIDHEGEHKKMKKMEKI
jgi:hypothetical protein